MNGKRNRDVRENARTNDHEENAPLFEKTGEKELGENDEPGRNQLIRLYLRKGEYMYARPGDIVMLESCDHLVRIYIIFEGQVKKTLHCNTLKEFLSKLPKDQFLRIGRFCAVNLKRLSGGDFNLQTFEFDFKVPIKLKHPISFTHFNTIGK